MKLNNNLIFIFFSVVTISFNLADSRTCGCPTRAPTSSSPTTSPTSSPSASPTSSPIVTCEDIPTSGCALDGNFDTEDPYTVNLGCQNSNLQNLCQENILTVNATCESTFDDLSCSNFMTECCSTPPTDQPTASPTSSPSETITCMEVPNSGCAMEGPFNATGELCGFFLNGTACEYNSFEVEEYCDTTTGDETLCHSFMQQCCWEAIDPYYNPN